MTFYAVLGWVAAAFGMAAAVPQLVRLWRSRTSAGVSTRLWQLNVGASLAWTLHGYYTGLINLQVPNLVCSVLFLGVLWFIARDRRQSFLQMLLLPGVLGVLLFGIDVWLGAVVYGAIVAVPLVVGQFAQLRYMMRSADLRGLALSTLVVNAVVQVLWFWWGLRMGEGALIVCAGSVGLLALANLVYYLWRRLRGTAAQTASVASGQQPARGAF